MRYLQSRTLSVLTSLAFLAVPLGTAVPTAFADTTTVTSPATGITASDATLNGLNGVTDATGSAFWVSTSTFSVASSTSPSLPANVYSTGDLGAVASTSPFSALLSSATIPAGLLPITASTTYFFTAWTYDGTTWVPGTVLNFSTLPNAPTVTGISPTSGTTTGGTSVTVTGTNLTGATSVQFGSTPATGVVVASSTSLTAIAPAGTGTVDVTVTTAGGTSATSSADQYTYTSVLVAPVISNVSANVTGTSTATITWNTDAAASGQVFYGTTTAYGSSTTLDPVASTTHSASISGLSEGTVYHYKVESTNAGGTATSTDHVFVTASTASSTPLSVSSVDVVRGTAVADGSFANGFEWVIHLIVPDNETQFQMKFANFTSASGTIPAAGNIRIFSAQSSNATSSGSAIVSTGNEYGTVLNLTGDTATSTAGRQIDVTVQVAAPFGTTPGTYSTTFGARSATP